MHIAYLLVTFLIAAMAAFSGVGKLRHDPKIVHIIHEVVRVPMNYFPHLAACEIAGAVGLIAGIWWRLPGIAAGVGLVLYFLGAIVAHLRVGDTKGIGAASFMLILSGAALILRVLNRTAGL